MLQYLTLTVILIAGMFFSFRLQKLTLAAAIAGGITGVFIFHGAGFTGLALLAAFFALGVSATSAGLKYKKKLALADIHNGRRNAGQVFANAGIAGILGLLVLFFPEKAGFLRLMMAAAFAAATADTLSSELGNVYGSRFYNILDFKKDKQGLNGVVSIEGTLAGIAGSLVIALVFAVGYGFDMRILWIALAGTVGNITDSLLGASLERSGVLGNNSVNFLNTLSASLFVLVF